MLPAFAPAADIHWDAADGNWDVATNWAGGVVPGASDRGLIDRAGGGTAHVTTDTVDVLGVSVANGNALSVETGGNLTTFSPEPPAGSPENPADGIWIGDGGAGSATVTGDGKLATSSGGYRGTIGVGRGSATGTLTVNGATALVDGNDLHVGGTNLPGNIASPGTGIVNLTEGKVNARGWSFVGRDGGSGTFNMTGANTTFATNGELHVGRGAGSTGVINQQNGTLTTTGIAFLGIDGGTGTYNISGGSVTVGNDFRSGAGNGSSGTVVQQGGNFQINAWGFTGRNGGTGQYQLSGASSTLQVNGTYIVGFEGNSDGTFTVTDGTVNIVKQGTNNDSGNLILGMDNASGTFNQTGGVVNSHWGFAGRAGTTNKGRGVFNHSGGTYSTQGWVRVGENPGSQGEYHLSGTAVLNVGGGDTDLGDDDLIVGVDPDGHGTMTIAGTSTANVRRDIRLGQAGGTGLIVQDGGDVNITAGAMFVGVSQGLGTGGVGEYQLKNGTIDVPLDVNVGQDANTNGTFSVSGGTATINRNLVVGRTGNGTHVQSGGSVTAAALMVGLNAGSTGQVNLSGGTLTALSTANNGTISASGTGVANLGAVSGSGSVSVADTAVVNAAHLRQASLAMTGGTVAIAETGNGTAAGVSNLGDYTLGGDARLDLTDNKLVTSKGVGTFTAGAYSGVQGDVAKAYNFGTWDQPGLTTSEDLADPTSGPLGGTTGIAVNKASEVLFIGDADTAVFLGQTVTGATTIAMYTYAGDVNLDGLVDAADYGVIDNWVQFPGTDGYMNGDFNYDGVIDAADYGIIDNTVQLQGAPFLGVNDTGAAAAAGLSGVTAVPEPATLSLLGLAAAGLLARRRRTK